jgi:hypothetical protein
MDFDQYNLRQKQFKRKLDITIKDRENENLKLKEKEKEIDEKFRYFSNINCEIMLLSDNILEQYKNSEYLIKMKKSDIIRTVMKKQIINMSNDDLLALKDKLNKDYIFDEEIQKAIKTETRKNLESFIKEYKTSKKSKALIVNSEIKSEFENVFRTQEFHIIEFEEKMNKAIEEYKFNENDLKEIDDLISLTMIQKYKELIKKELKYTI